MRLATALVLLLLSLATAASAVGVDVGGQLEYGLGYLTAAKTVGQNQLTYKVDVERDLGFYGKVHLDWDGKVNYRPQGSSPTLSLNEAYVDAYLDSMDLRFGRQLVSWGTADGINPTSVVNPREALSFSLDAMSGVPVPALQGTYYLPSGGSVTAVGITEFVAASGALSQLGAIATQIGASMGGQPLQVSNPAPIPADGSQFELAVRGEQLIGSHNVYVSYFHGWDDNPVAWLEYAPTQLGPVPTGIASKYRRVQEVGLATAGTLGGAGVWTETSYVVPEKLAALDKVGAISSNDPYIEVVAGGDYTFANAAMVSAEVVYNGAGSLLSPYKAPAEDVTPQTYVVGTVRYSPKLGHNLEVVGLANLGNQGALGIARYSYDLNDVTAVSVDVSKVFANATADLDNVRGQVEAIHAKVSVSF